jgi:hypothetical protein
VRWWSVTVGWLSAALLLAACAQNAQHLTTTFLDYYADPNPTPAGFSECHGYGCTETSRATLSGDAWKRIAAVFKPAAKDARAERRQIAHAVAVTQLLVGAQTGTAAHQWTHDHMKILPNNGDPTQLDCIDEAVDTWTYLTMMDRAGLFRFHHAAKLSYAGSMVDPNLRNTAVIQEINGGYFAVDPSLVDVGVPPPIIPLDVWLGDWPPDLAANDATAPLKR